MDDVTQLLFDALVSGKNSNEIVEIAQHEIFHNPIMLTNASFRVLAMSSEEDPDDPVWNYARAFRCCSRESIELFEKDEASGKLFSDGEPFLYDENMAEKLPRILAGIQNGGVTLGYLVIFYANSEFQESDIRLAQKVCQCLSVTLLKGERNPLQSQSIKDYTLLQLIQSGNDQTIDFNETISNLNMKLKPYFQVAVLQLSTQKEAHYFPYFKQVIESISPALSCILYEHALIVLYNSNKCEADEYLKQIGKLLRDFRLSFGVSRNFIDLKDLRYYVKQAEKAVEIGKKIRPGEFCYYFKDFEFFFLIERFSSSELLAMRSEEYLMLKRYDEKYDTEYIRTVKVFFESGMSRAVASKNLNIHRNTLAYRLDKIGLLIRDDYSDISKLQSIYRSILIELYLLSKEGKNPAGK